MKTTEEKTDLVYSFLERYKKAGILNRELAFFLGVSFWAVNNPKCPKQGNWGLYSKISDYESAPKRKLDLSILTKHEKLQLLYDLKSEIL